MGKQQDLGEYAKKDDLKSYIKGDDMKNYIRNDQLGNYVQTDTLEKYIMKNELGEYVKKKDLQIPTFPPNFDPSTLAMDINNLKSSTLRCENNECILPENITSVEISKGVSVKISDKDNICIYSKDKSGNLFCFNKVTGNYVPVSAIIQTTTTPPITMTPFGQ